MFLEYKVYGGIVVFFTQFKSQYDYDKDDTKILLFFLYSHVDHLLVLTSKSNNFFFSAYGLIFVQENNTSYIKEWREYILTKYIGDLICSRGKHDGITSVNIICIINKIITETKTFNNKQYQFTKFNPKIDEQTKIVKSKVLTNKN
jgi:hypothetical protein